ncbi:hypothetical protein KIL84_013298 [Mauremys mutica]|uniref:IL-7Ralpha fibronectin type III domain-containing protein n=1 Tax=Mauremys mutica TaxID=74926 RepID=A0A9D3WXS5_9SAUR|nr:hypothetical protein KIL84_013298 [Mauremys mutica]
MTRTSTAFGILLFFLLHTTSGESGSTSEDESDDELDVECFSQLEIKEDCHSLTCNITELDLNNTNVNLTVCNQYAIGWKAWMEDLGKVLILSFVPVLNTIVWKNQEFDFFYFPDK